MEIPLSQLSESPLNARKTWGDIRGLADSLKVKGQLQSILVRPGKDSGGYEIVAGHRRFRAAKLAGLESLSADVRELSDEAVVEISVIENCKRMDLSPIEEAEGYQSLRDKFGQTVAEIAQKVARSESHIHKRLKLLDLPKDALDAVSAGVLKLDVALALALIPNPKMRTEASKEVLSERRHVDYDPKTKEDIETRGPMDAKSALALIRRRYHLRLDGCGWRLDDAELLPKVGPCSTCTKRNLNQQHLFAELAEPEDLCCDPDCFAKKREAAWRARKAELEAKGRKVLDGAAAAEVVSDLGINRGSGYVSLKDRCWDDPKQRTYEQILGKRAAADHVVLARSESGQVHELLPADVAKAAAKEAKKEVGVDDGAQKAKLKESEKAERAENARKARIDLLTAEYSVGALVDSFKGDPRAQWRTIGELVLDDFEKFGESAHLEVARRRGLVVIEGAKEDANGLDAEERAFEALRKALKSEGAFEASGLVLELLLAKLGAFETWGGTGPDTVKRLAKLWEVDLKTPGKSAKKTVEALADGYRRGDHVLFWEAGEQFEALVTGIGSRGADGREKDTLYLQRIKDGKKLEAPAAKVQHALTHEKPDKNGTLLNELPAIDGETEMPAKAAAEKTAYTPAGRAWKPGDACQYRPTGGGTFDAFVIRIEGSTATIERVSDGQREKMPITKLLKSGPGYGAVDQSGVYGTCKACGCTDENACEEGCGWVDHTHTLCSACVEAEPGDKPEPKKPKAKKPSAPAKAKGLKVGDVCQYREGAGTFDAMVTLIDGDLLTLERCKDGKKVTRPASKVEVAR